MPRHTRARLASDFRNQAGLAAAAASEFSLTNPAKQPDASKWQTELAYPLLKPPNNPEDH